jgi:hypothetical protein
VTARIADRVASVTMYVDETRQPRQRVKNGEMYTKPKGWWGVFVPS